MPARGKGRERDIEREKERARERERERERERWENKSLGRQIGIQMLVVGRGDADGWPDRASRCGIWNMHG